MSLVAIQTPTATEVKSSLTSDSEEELEDSSTYMATKLQNLDAKKRAVTLSRICTPSKKPGFPSRPFDDTSNESPNFTRIRRMHTLKCIVQRPHPVLKAKSNSIPPDITGLTSKPLISIGNKVAPEIFSSAKDTSFDEDNHTDYSETEIQEETLLFGGSPTSTISTTSDDHNVTPLADTSNSTHFCTKCHEGFQSKEAFVMFGNDKFHLNCFECGHCHEPMGSMEEFLVGIDGLPLCLACSPNCHTCGKKILQNHVSVLKMDFHEECLACFQCGRKFSLVTKVYANSGEPCCSNCINPVFNDMWSPTKAACSHAKPPSVGAKMSSVLLSPSPSTDSGVSETASTDEQTNETCHANSCRHSAAKLAATTTNDSSTYSVIAPLLNPKLESLSRSITLYSSNNHHSILRPSFSEPNLRQDVSNTAHGLSISSLRAILYDEHGSVLFVNYCVSNDIVEYIVFWLDVEHFKQFDGGDEDLKLFAHHIVTKYIGYYAELPVPMPRDLQKMIFDRVESCVTTDLFNEAQQYIYDEMEREFLNSFLQSEDGRNYLKILVERDLMKMTKKRSNTSLEDFKDHPIQATITNFERRHLDTKYYVYEVDVQVDNQKYFIYRRYSEWYSLNQTLRKAFPLEIFPPLPKKIFLGRSQKRTVAQQRMGELQQYLQGLLSMSHEVSHSVILRRFFKQTETDKEDESFNRRIQELQKRRES